MSTQPVALYEIGPLFANVWLSAAGDRIEAMTPYPGARRSLEMARRRGTRLGILSELGNVTESELVDWLRRAGLLGYFERVLIVQPPPGALPSLQEAADLAIRQADAGGAVPPMVFVSDDAGRRVEGRAAGFLCAPHPVLVAPLLDGEALQFLQIRIDPEPRADWTALLRGLPVAPLYVSAGGSGGGERLLYVVTDTATARTLRDLRFQVEPLGGGDPQTNDLYLLPRAAIASAVSPPGLAAAFEKLRPAGAVLAATKHDLLVSAPDGRLLTGGVDGGLHHHGMRLTPSLELLSPNRPARSTVRPPAPPLAAAPFLDKDERAALDLHIRPDLMEEIVERYSGTRTLANGRRITSRHIGHPGNRDAVSELARELSEMPVGRLAVRRYPFTRERVRCENVEARIPASGLGGIVVVGAHLDSTSGRADLASQNAPGADDNASGLAAVLCAARALLDLAGRDGVMHREIRFVLFDAEEYGLAGSARYADEAKRLNHDIAAMFNVDMVGYDGVAPGVFEVHATHDADGDVPTRSRGLADLVVALSNEIAPGLLHPEVFPGDGKADPAHGLGDHSSFHKHGFTACLVTEDFFGTPGNPQAAGDRNKAYHTANDRSIHLDYAVNIARTVAAAAWVAATRELPYL